MTKPAATPGGASVPRSDASDPGEPGEAQPSGPFRAALVTAGEIDTSSGEVMERSDGRARDPAIWRDHAGASSATALDEDVALAQAAAQAATGVLRVATARANDAVPVPLTAQPRESSIRTVSALAIATACREADAIAHNAAATRAPAGTARSARLAAPRPTGSAMAPPGTAGPTVELLERAIADIAHDPPADSSTAITDHPAGGVATAAMFETPVVATHRVPGGLGRTGSAGKRRGARALTDPAPAAIAGPTPSITPMPVVDPSATARTPLEKAVHDLISRLGDHADGERAPRTWQIGEPGIETTVQAPIPQRSAPVAHPAPAREPARTRPHTQPPEPMANPSHVHLVVDDGPERVVVTVAMRGNAVHVALRGTDDATTAAFARNAATLDHAMHARGLVLGELTTERESQQRSRQSSEPPPPPPRHPPDAEPFELEETP